MHASRPRAPLLAWVGGGCFVASLGWFAWSFFVRFGRIQPDGPLANPLLVDLTLFTVFALHHSVLARSGAKRWLTRHVPPHLERSLYVWVASLLFIAVCALWMRSYWSADTVGWRDPTFWAIESNRARVMFWHTDVTPPGDGSSLGRQRSTSA